MRTTFIAALLPNATAKVQKNLYIRKKISLTGLDSLDFCRRQGCKFSCSLCSRDPNYPNYQLTT